MYQDRIRHALAQQFPNVTTYFQAADITSQVLNFGLPAAIDAQISGNHLQSDYAIALRLENRMKLIPGVNDLRIAQPQDYPAYQVNVDRAKALQFGITQQQVASSLLASLSGASSAAAQLLARSGQRRQLQRHPADAAASDQFGRRDGQYSAEHQRVAFYRHGRRGARAAATAGQHRDVQAQTGIPRSLSITPCSA